MKVIYVLIVYLNKLIMKKVLLLLFWVGLLLASCEVVPEGKTPEKPPVSNVKIVKDIQVEYICGYLQTNPHNTNSGFYRIKLNDGKEFLVYKESNGVTMVQIK